MTRMHPLTREQEERFADGIRLFNGGSYWESHEAWEDVWREIEGEEKLFVQGLIQAAAAYHLVFTRPRFTGGAKNARKALSKLDLFPTVVWGVKVERVRAELRETLRMIEREGGASIDASTLLHRPTVDRKEP